MIIRYLGIVLCLVANGQADRGLLQASPVTAPSEKIAPHKDKYGIAISDEECQNRNHASELDEVLSYSSLPYSFRGPEASCSTFGCQTDYWGTRCRFKGIHLPACPMESRWKIVHNIIYHYRETGAAWAADALELKPCDMWQQLRGRTTYIVGDSLSQDFMTSLSCFMVEYQEPMHKRLSDSEDVMVKLRTNLKGREMPTWCFHLPQDTRICAIRSNKAPRMVKVILPILADIADREKDIVVLNFGAWYNRKWHEEELAELEYDVLEFESMYKRLRDRLPKRIFWRESTAQHFDTISGAFDPNRAPTEQRCTAPGHALGVNLTLGHDRSVVRTHGFAKSILEFEALIKGGERNLVTQPVIDRLGLHTLRIYNYSLLFHDVHHNYHKNDNSACVDIPCDCSHACLPSWNQLIFSDFHRALKTLDWDSYKPVAAPAWQSAIGNRSNLWYHSDDDTWLDLISSL